jgi:diguanylate cyclase (GGDEF)-like protein
MDISSRPSSKSLQWLSGREVLDAAVISATSILAGAATIYWNGFQLLYDFSRANQEWHLDKLTTMLLFLGVAVAIFGVRRIFDQRREKRRREAAERYARSLALRDPLTRLPNRRCFEQQLGVALSAANFSQGMPTVLLMDLVGFQALNDLHGYAGGDAALSQVAVRLRECIGPSELLARFGDDEFAICLPSADAESASRIALAVTDRLNAPIHIGGGEQSIGVTIGIAQISAEDASVGEILRRAHVALYRARATHVGCCFYDENMDSHVRERSIMEKELRAAIGTDAIRPYYQPIVDLTSTRIIAFEALARWTHPEKGPISPAVFIPLAEALGLIDELTNQLFSIACRDAAAWSDDIALSFNFTAGQLKDPQFVDRVLAILAQTSLLPHRLEAEITESALVEDIAATRHAMNALRAKGIRIVLDDFGTGFSSLYHLRELSFDKLKIDRSFVQTMSDNGGSDVIVRAIVGLSKGLGLAVTAEGIETAEQAASVLERGAHQGQGYLFGRPMPAGESRRLLAGFKQCQAAA